MKLFYGSFDEHFDVRDTRLLLCCFDVHLADVPVLFGGVRHVTSKYFEFKAKKVSL